jgi:hypothetical protein
VGAVNAWELQLLQFALHYSDELENEADIAAAVEVAGGDYPRWRSAA